jgi:hypothetical protein
MSKIKKILCDIVMVTTVFIQAIYEEAKLEIMSLVLLDESPKCLL